MKNCFPAKSLGTTLTVLVFLFVSLFSMLFFAQGGTEPEAPYTVVQDFEAMTSGEDVLAYYNTSGVEPGSSSALSLSTDGGFEGSQAVRVDYSLNYQSSWARINTDKNNLTASGEGLSFWINVSQPMRIQATAWSSWVMYTHDLITLEAGDNFVQVPWGDFKGREEWEPYNDVELSPNEPTRNLRIGFMLFPVEDELTEGTAYIDEIGFINTAPTTTVTIEPEQDYEVFQNFEGMTSQADLEDSSLILHTMKTLQ